MILARQSDRAEAFKATKSHENIIESVHETFLLLKETLRI
jgi:hypothetical protein